MVLAGYIFVFAFLLYKILPEFWSIKIHAGEYVLGIEASVELLLLEVSEESTSVAEFILVLVLETLALAPVAEPFILSAYIKLVFNVNKIKNKKEVYSASTEK